MADVLILIFAIALLMVVGLLYLAGKEIQSQLHRKPQPSRTFRPRPQYQGTGSRPSQNDQSLPFALGGTTGPVPYMDQELLKLMNGDRKGANRLLEGVKKRNPGRSPQWCYEKVIFDLTRDRH